MAHWPPLNTLTFTHIKVLMVDFQKKDLDKKKIFVVRDEASYFYKTLGFSLPSLLINPALVTVCKVSADSKVYNIGTLVEGRAANSNSKELDHSAELEPKLELEKIFFLNSNLNSHKTVRVHLKDI